MADGLKAKSEFKFWVEDAPKSAQSSEDEAKSVPATEDKSVPRNDPPSGTEKSS